jgi:hypothetical protein
MHPKPTDRKKPENASQQMDLPAGTAPGRCIRYTFLGTIKAINENNIGPKTIARNHRKTRAINGI